MTNFYHGDGYWGPCPDCGGDGNWMIDPDNDDYIICECGHEHYIGEDDMHDA